MATFVTENGAAAGTGAGSASFSLTTSGSNLVLYVASTHYGSGSDVTGVTWNTSQNLTKLTSGIWFDAGGTTSFWRLIAPAVTTANVVVTFPASITEYSVCAVVYSGVDQVTPERTVATSYPGSGTSSISPAATSVSGDTVLGGFGYSDDGGTIGSSSGATVRSTHRTAAHNGTSMFDQIASGASTALNMNMSAPTSSGVGGYACALIDFTGGGGPTGPTYRIVQSKLTW